MKKSRFLINGQLQTLPDISYQNSLSLNTHGQLKLHYEIIDYVNNRILPNDHQIKLREKAISIFTSLISSWNPFFKVRIFGSFSQSLSTVNSDIDIVVFKSPVQVIEDQMMIEKISRDMKRSQLGLYKNVKIIEAKIPIIKAICVQTGIHLDISVNNENGIEIGWRIQYHVRKEPLIKYTILLLKDILHKNKLNETINGGMGSFLLFTLVFYYYQRCFLKRTEMEEMNWAKFCCGFLQFFKVFDYKKYGISILKGGELFYKCERWGRGDELCVESCVDSSNDIGKPCTRIEEIIELFGTILDRLKNEGNESWSYIYAIMK